jgi:transcriptional regulator with XRE-family HTH domain
VQLKDYLLLTGSTERAFAEAIGVSQQAVSRYVSGARIPRPNVVQRIQAVTKGAVCVSDFFSPAVYLSSPDGGNSPAVATSAAAGAFYSEEGSDG